MNRKSNNPITEDPRLTAYALGELGPRARAEIERLVARDPEARKFVEETRAFARDLGAALAPEEAPELDPDRIRAIRLAAYENAETRGRAWGWFFHPAFAWSAGCAAALVLIAGLAVPASQRARPARHMPPEPPVPAQAQPALIAGQNAASAPATEHLRTTPAPEAVADIRNLTVRVDALAGSESRLAGPEEKGMLAERAKAQPGADLAISGVKQDEFDRAGEPAQEIVPTIVSGASKPMPVPAAMPATAIAAPAPQAGNSLAMGGKPKVATGAYRELLPNDGYADSRVSLKVREEAPVRAQNADDDGLGLAAPGQPRRTFNTEGYDRIEDNPFLETARNPLSTFSIDVDTGSYANVRRFLNQGALPPPGAVRIEELVNYFEYSYPPAPEGKPFSVAVDLAQAPWNSKHVLARIGLKGREIDPAKRPPCNLVFLLDASGSMNQPNKLPLVKESMKILLEQLGPKDRVAIVTYAGASGLALPSTPADQKRNIREAIEELRPGGSTHASAGIHLAYDIAKANFIQGGVNRVILATDGDFNVGITDRDRLLALIADKAKSGVFLTVVGFGMGNLKDGTMEQLADKGNGAYGYIDGEAEARRLFARHATASLVTIAKDVKIQVDFNPAKVRAYRLIGYENRALRAEDFNDDTKDAGEIGSGHTVTALYELVPAGVDMDLPDVDKPKHMKPGGLFGGDKEWMTVKLRYKEPAGATSSKIEEPVSGKPSEWAAAPADFKFAASVAGFGMLLRDSPHKGSASWGMVLENAASGRGADPHGDRGEFLDLVRAAEKLSGRE